MPIGPTELLIILLSALFVFAAGKLPDVGAGLGKGIREFRDPFREDENPKGTI